MFHLNRISTRFFKTPNLIIFVLTVIFSAYVLLPAATAADNVKMKTYIVYDSPVRPDSDFPLVTTLIEYIGHFDVTCQELPLSKWRPGALRDADLVVFVGLNDTLLPQALLQEMSNAKRIIWFERNIEQLAAYLKWSDFKVDGFFIGWLHLNYKKEVIFNDELKNVLITHPGQGSEIIATVANFSDNKPLAWQKGHIYFCGFLDFNQFYRYALADLLHQFMPNQHAHSNQALLRVEDVSPMTDVKTLKAVIDTIRKYRIPYAIGVTPIGIMGDKQIPLHERGELVKALQEAQKGGASIILHGYSHTNRYSPEAEEGYEFWNARDNKPMENDEEFTKERLDAGITELVRCGLIPVAFEPPHYAMSKTGYKTLSRYFNILSGRVQISDDNANFKIPLPYITNSVYLNEMIVVPENIGYYDSTVSYSAERMIENIGQILVTQDGLAGFYYHSYLPPDKLELIIESIFKQGYYFLDLSQMPIKVQNQQIKITGQYGNINVEVAENLKKSWDQNPLEALASMLGTIHIVVLLITIIILIITMFIFIVIRLRVGRDKRYEG